ncbi:MAG TPA: hypothetical protein VL860_06870 [Planctomycetota bacterium]|nr:hypothetical protein [Planctomycetota bacterium]
MTSIFQTALARLTGACSLGLLALALSQPAACAADAAEQQFDKQFGAELRKVQASPGDTRDDLDLARRLFATADQAAPNPAFRAALLRHAIALALLDPEGIPQATAGAELLASTGLTTAPAAWQVFNDAAAPILQRHNLGATDPLLEPYFEALKKQALAADALGDSAAAERALIRLERDATAWHCKFRADEAAQLRAKLRYMAPFKQSAQRELAKVKPAASDPQAGRAAVETALGLTGDLDTCLDNLRALNDPRWNLILAFHASRTDASKTSTGGPAIQTAAAPPLPSSSALQILEAADYLATLTKAPRPPSLPGRAFFLSESATLLVAAQAADQSGLTTQQKLDLASKTRAAQDAARDARADLTRQLDSAGQIPWVPLLSPALDNDWIRAANTAAWNELPGNELQSARNWGSILRHRRAHSADFILEGELQRVDAISHPLLLLREHNLGACYTLEFGENQGHLLFTKPQTDDVELAEFPVNLPVKQWVSFRLVFDGNHILVWIDGELKADVRDDGELTAGGLCIGAALGSSHFRNLRLREL